MAVFAFCITGSDAFVRLRFLPESDAGSIAAGLTFCNSCSSLAI